MRHGASNPGLSVAITTTGRAQGLQRAVREVAAQAAVAGGSDIELVVIFDGCEPVGRDILASLGIDVKARVNAQASGIAQARNQALEIATGDVIAFLDDDAVPAATWLASLRRGLRAYPDRCCFGGRVRCAAPANVIAQLRDEVYYRETFGTWYLGHDGDGDDLLGPPYVNGGNCAYRSEIFNAIGGFREDLPAYVDVEFGLRAGCRDTGVLLDGFSIEHAHPNHLRPYLRRCLASGRARARMRSHPAHGPRAVLKAVACNLAWTNVARAGRLPARRGAAYLVLTLQELTHAWGYVRP